MDAITNWDGFTRKEGYYNAVLSVVRTVAVDVTEPVTLTEAKTHLLVTYTDRDTEITALIRRCRKALEDHKETSIVSNSIVALLKNTIGGIQIPYGPVTAVSEMKDFDDNIIASTNYELNNYSIVYPTYDYLKVTYTAGYTTVPDNIKEELLELIAWVFFNKGTMAEGLKKISIAHSRKSWLV